ncbi:hypothetical protein CSC75_18065 [Pseudoxanthomonas wuyuanensis]|nr:hypothetical protein CSC75_18065 [Pseudoxanthomonas wuyuanensis]
MTDGAVYNFIFMIIWRSLLEDPQKSISFWRFQIVECRLSTNTMSLKGVDFINRGGVPHLKFFGS